MNLVFIMPRVEEINSHCCLYFLINPPKFNRPILKSSEQSVQGKFRGPCLAFYNVIWDIFQDDAETGKKVLVKVRWESGVDDCFKSFFLGKLIFSVRLCLEMDIQLNFFLMVTGYFRRSISTGFNGAHFFFNPVIVSHVSRSRRKQTKGVHQVPIL